MRVNPNRQTKLSELLKHVESLTFAYKCNGLIAGLNMFETCRVLPFETRLLKLDPFALCDAGASTRKLVAYFFDLRKICRCLSKHRGDATRCAIVATWPQRKLNMTVRTRLGRYFEISAYKMLQDVTRCHKMLQDVTRCYKMLQDVKWHSETQGLSKVGHLPAMCHQSWKKVLGMRGPHDGALLHFSTLSLTPRRNNFLQARKHAPRFEQLSLDLQSSEFFTSILTMYAMYSMQSHEQTGESLQ